jgi:hypothetical protein
MSGDDSRLLKKTHMLRCAQSPRSNVLPEYASARRFFARLASDIFLSSLKLGFQRSLDSGSRELPFARLEMTSEFVMN